MIPIGRYEKPLLEYVIRNMKQSGINDIYILVKHKKHQIINYFNDGSRFGVKIRYVEDPADKVGNGAAILNLLRKMKITCGTLLIYYGDIVTTLNLSKVVEYHREKNADITIVVSKYRAPVGIIRYDRRSGRVSDIAEKPLLDVSASIGILASEVEVLRKAFPLFSKLKSIDFMADVLPYLLDKGVKIYAYDFKGFWYDVGSLERYEKLKLPKSFR